MHGCVLAGLHKVGVFQALLTIPDGIYSAPGNQRSKSTEIFLSEFTADASSVQFLGVFVVWGFS